MPRRCRLCDKPIRGRPYVVALNGATGQAEVYVDGVRFRTGIKRAGVRYDPTAVYNLGCAKAVADANAADAKRMAEAWRSYA